MAQQHFIQKKFGHRAYSFNIDTKEIKELPYRPTNYYPITPEHRTLYCGAKDKKQAILNFKIQVTEIMNRL